MSQNTAPTAPAPIKGYNTRPSEEQIALVNENKVMEELTLRQVDRHMNMVMNETMTIDPRWVALARSQLQQGFMNLNRSVMRPARLDTDLSNQLPLIGMLAGRTGETT